MQETVWARAVYDVVATIVAGTVPSEDHVARAAQAPESIWQRVLALESCGAWLDAARRRSPNLSRCVAPASALLHASGGDALRGSLVAMRQLAEIGELATGASVPVLALKGAARLLTGEAPGARTMSDIDLLVDGRGARALHDALQSKLGYRPEMLGTPDRHLPTLCRPGGLPVEIHHRLRDGSASALDRRIWIGARSVPHCASVLCPDATALLLHALDHAVVVHRTARFRLRDVIDVATLVPVAIDSSEVHRYVHGHPDRRSMGILLAAAQNVPGFPGGDHQMRSETQRRRAWRQIRRVGRTRLLAPARGGIPPATDPRVVVLSQLAQGSPRNILKLAARAMAMPRRAAGLLSGTWLPPEAEAASVDPDRVIKTRGA